MADVTPVVETALAVLASIGTGGAIVLKLSGYLGHIWADRMMAKERAEHEQQLATFQASEKKKLTELRAELEAKNDEYLERLKAAVELQKSKLAGAHQQKLDVYREVTDLIVAAMVELQLWKGGGGQITLESWKAFEAARLRAHGRLGMLAPQPVLDAFSNLIDYFLAASERSQEYDFKRARELAWAMINEVRIDLGIDKSPVAYRGMR